MPPEQDWLDVARNVFTFGLQGLGGSLAGTVIEDVIRDSDPAICVIHDVFAHTGAYVVRTPGGGTKLASMAGHTSVTPMGVRTINHLQIGDSVYCIFPKRTEYGYIMGVVSPQMFDARLILPDSLVMRSRVGFVEDQMHHQPYQQEKNDLANFSCGRPADALQGDGGMINELGVAIWVGKLMAQLRASDVAKIEAFWGDDLLRIFGYNLEMFTAGEERFAFDDEGEYSEILRSTPFPWEALGVFEPNKAPFDSNEGESGGLSKGNEKSRFEPTEGALQAMVPRRQELRGYLGDGRRVQIVMHPVNPPDINTSDDEEPLRGLLEVSEGLDGTWSVRSAKQVILQKSLILPVPKQLLDPDDPSGDTAKDYKASGVFGEGPTQMREPYEWSSTTTPTTRGTELLEQMTYFFGKFGLQPIDAHTKDWKTPEAEDMQIDDSEESSIDPDLFKPLEFKYSTDLPKFGTITIDQREGHDVRYYRTQSIFHMLDDGSINIEDGYGSQILMSGGNIHFSCQGDEFHRPGRSFITWAARDFIARAGNSADVTAARGDLRLKAEKNLHMLAGNDQSDGSLLLECRASLKPSKGNWDGNQGEDILGGSIIIKSDQGTLDLWANQTYIGVPENEAGRVVINAGNGPATIAGGDVSMEALNQFAVLVGADRAGTAQPPQFTLAAGSAQLRSTLDMVGNLNIWPGSKGAGNLKVGGTLEVKGSISSEGMVTANKHFQSEEGGPVNSEANYQFKPSPKGKGKEQDDEADKVKEATFLPFDKDAFLEEDSQMKRTLQDFVGFSCRLSKTQYKIDDTFEVFESRWQQMYRAFGSQKTWDEPIVDSPDNTPTRPHPGHEAWENGDHYKYLDPSAAKNWDYAAGRPKKRSEQAKATELSTAKLTSEYVINVQED